MTDRLATTDPAVKLTPRQTWQDADDGKPVALVAVRAEIERGQLGKVPVPELVPDFDPRTRAATLEQVRRVADRTGDPLLARYAREMCGVPWWYDPALGLDRQRYPWDPVDLPARIQAARDRAPAEEDP